MSNVEMSDRAWMILCAAIRDGMMMPSTGIKRLKKLGYTHDEAVLEITAMKAGSTERLIQPRSRLAERVRVTDKTRATIAVEVKEDLQVIEIFDFYDETYAPEELQAEA